MKRNLTDENKMFLKGILENENCVGGFNIENGETPEAAFDSFFETEKSVFGDDFIFEKSDLEFKVSKDENGNDFLKIFLKSEVADEKRKECC